MRDAEPCMFCGQPIALEGIDPCQVFVTNQWGRPNDEQANQGFWSH